MTFELWHSVTGSGRLCEVIPIPPSNSRSTCRSSVAIVPGGYAVINVTTHQGSELAIGEQTQPVRRLGPRAFAVLIGFELLLMAGVLVWALFWLTPSATPYATSADLRPLNEAVMARVSGAVADPLIEVAPGLSARESNLRGFRYEGGVFYYYVEGQANHDPFSRGAVRPDQIEILLRDETGPAAVVIYRIL